MADPVSIGVAIPRVLSWFGALGGRRPLLSKEQQRELAAAGYTPGPRGTLRDPNGQIVGQRTAYRRYRRTPGGPGYRPPSWQVSPLPTPWVPPTTDQEIYDFEQSSGIPPERGFVGPVPTIPDVLPPVTVPQPARTAGGRILRTVLGRALLLPSVIFYPSRTADDDTLGRPEPIPQPQPQGPTRRPRIRVSTLPDAPTATPGPPQPRIPSDFERPDTETRPDLVTSPQPLPIPLPTTWPQPATLPQPAPSPAPTPAPSSRPFSLPWPVLLPYLLPSGSPVPSLRPPLPSPGLPQPSPVAPPSSLPGRTPVPTPLTFAQPLGLPFNPPANADPCAAQKRPRQKRKRRTVCYSGTYRDKATGLSKSPKRKIKCR